MGRPVRRGRARGRRLGAADREVGAAADDGQLLALGHTPDQARFYILDFGGGTLADLEKLPHVGEIATRLDANRVWRTVAEIRAMLAERERTKATQRADVFLVVDGWLTLQQEFEDLGRPSPRWPPAASDTGST